MFAALHIHGIFPGVDVAHRSGGLRDARHTIYRKFGDPPNATNQAETMYLVLAFGWMHPHDRGNFGVNKMQWSSDTDISRMLKYHT